MAAKKSFKADINPAMQFITQPKDTAAPSTPTMKAPTGYKLNPFYVETKSRRLQLLVQPSLHARLKERADKDGMSLNELVNSFLEDGLREEREHE